MPYVDYKDSSGNPATASSSAGMPVTLTSLIAGENQTFNRLMGGAVCKYAVVTGDGVVSATPAILYGVVLIAAGTMANIYDNTAASGTVVIPSTTASVNFGGAGVLMNNGIYADWTSGTWLVLYAN